MAENARTPGQQTPGQQTPGAETNRRSADDTTYLSPAGIPAALELIDTETAKLLATVATLDDAAFAEPSLCAGWTRGHIVTHLARNAESLVRLVVWARTGVRTDQYPSKASRDADIEEGAPRPAVEQWADLDQACQLVRDALAALSLPLETHVVEMSSGPADARDIPRRRLNEVVIHHLDLLAGYTLADAHPLAVVDLLELALSRLEPNPQVPGMTLLSDEGDRYVVRGGGQEIQGPAAALLGWVVRGLGDDVRSDAPLPHLP